MKALSEWESKHALGPDLPRPDELLTTTVEEALALARRHGRVVMKASGPAHKTDRGAVLVGLGPEQVAEAWPRLAGLGDGAVLVAEEVRGELELIVGGFRDPQFGPVLTVGLGGVATELLHDVAFLLSPPAPGELDRALAGLRSAPLLDGLRGRPPVDRTALGSIVDAVARLLEDDAVLEIDCNPVIVRDGRPLVADALVVLGP